MAYLERTSGSFSQWYYWWVAVELTLAMWRQQLSQKRSEQQQLKGPLGLHSVQP